MDTGWTVLDIAKFRGETPIVEMLVKAGAKSGKTDQVPMLKPVRDNTVRNAVQASLPLLQRADARSLAAGLLCASGR